MTSLEKCMVLHSFMCNQFGRKDLHSILNLCKGMADDFAPDSGSRYAYQLFPCLHRDGVTQDELARYDANILAHSQKLGMTDENGKSWKPFQYLALLFTERYLDLYFRDAEALVEALNQWRKQWKPAPRRRQRKNDLEIPEYARDDISTLAFQSATGSGKTLLLHANILQYQHYLKEHKQQHKLNKIILVTPDEGMSRQHLRELGKSGIPAQLFSGQSNTDILSSGGQLVDVIDIHKFAEKKGIKRVAADSFEENNLVLVDEGHLGVGGTKWRNYREQLAKNGFTFEYSATFNQAVSGNDDNRKKLRYEYGKSILFDYSYKFFYDDGYGKDYKISNLKDGDSEANNYYLLACLLSFYQQCRIYQDKGGQWRDFNIAKPLWVFLGKTVTGGKTAGKNETKSDVVRIVLFLAWALNARSEVIEKIERLISGDTGLIDENGADIFKVSFPYIKNKTPQQIYDDLCKSVFIGKGQLHISHLTGEDELQLSAGDAHFGVINVGDSSGLYSKLEAIRNELKATGDSPFELRKEPIGKPLFDRVDENNSQVTIVIGARKFAAGWNSWRVSTMGLMHVGTGEGPQIIQMFGRGVRLKGYEMSLKRHSAIEGVKPDDGDQLKLLETLNIFGLKASYMEKFKEYLSKEGVKIDRISFTLPVKTQFDKAQKLKILKKRNSAGEFQYSDICFDLPLTAELASEVTLDRYGTLQMLESQASAAETTSQRNTGYFEERHWNLMNQQTIYRKVLKRKRRCGWHNMTIRLETIRALLENHEWYHLYIPAEKMELSEYGRVREWEELAADLICEYADRHWRKARNRWEHQHIKAVPLDKTNPNLIEEYELRVDAEQTKLIEKIEALVEQVANGDYEKTFDCEGVQMSLFKHPFQTYHPLLYIPSGSLPVVQSTPIALNEGEAKFIEKLKEVAAIMQNSERLRDKEIYLMRNLSRGKGISFFDDHAFYPDFIIWIQHPNKKRQDILFIDPKGLQRFDRKTKRKANLHEKIKDTQEKIQEKHPKIFLHAYIWTETRPQDIGTDPPMTASEHNKEGIYFANIPGAGILELLENALAN